MDDYLSGYLYARKRLRPAWLKEETDVLRELAAFIYGLGTEVARGQADVITEILEERAA